MSAVAVKKYPREISAAISSALWADIQASRTLRHALETRQLGDIGLRRLLFQDIQRGVFRAPGPVIFPHLRKFVQTLENSAVQKIRELRGGMGQFEAIITALAPVLNTAVKATGSYYGARQMIKAQKDIGKVELQREAFALQAAKIRQMTEQMRLANAAGTPGAAAGDPAGTPVKLADGREVIIPPGQPIPAGAVYSPDEGIPTAGWVVGGVLVGGGILYALSKAL